MGKAAHLTRRFFVSLWPGGPSRENEAWAREHLSEQERALWSKMRGPDRRHAVQVARRVESETGGDNLMVTAALLHDVGKIDSCLGVYGRVVATLSAAVAGPETARDWVRGSGFTRRVGLYLLHPKLGGDHLGMAGSDPFVEAWAREHHSPEEEWTVPAEMGQVLKAADDD